MTIKWWALPQPAVFEPSGGKWMPGGVSVVTEESALKREAERLRIECSALGIGHGTDSVVRLGTRSEHAAEAYSIEVCDEITIVGGNTVGVFRGTRQLVQNLRANGFVPRGSASGLPAVGERGLHLDSGRKHFPAEWIIAQLHAAADVGINVFQWHFSENEGFRIASTRFPEIVSDEHISHDEVRRILETAADLHIEVIPSFDMPGHLRHVLARHPEFQLPPPVDAYDSSAPPQTLTSGGHALNIAEPDAVTFAHDLIDDMASAFPECSKWNLGGDEFVDFARIDDNPTLARAARERFGDMATGFDLLTAFVNDIADHLSLLGLQARVWNDGMLRSEIVKLNPDVVLTWWTNWNAQMRPLDDAISMDHGLVNFNDSLLYYVLGENAGYRYPTARRIWEADWHPGLFASGWSDAGQSTARQELLAPYPRFLLGAAFAVWADRPEAQNVEGVAAGIRSPLRAMAERGWNGGSRLSLEEFTAIDLRIGRAAPAEPAGPDNSLDRFSISL